MLFYLTTHGRPAHAWFLKIDSLRIVGMRVRVCVSAPEAINNYWHDMNLIRLVKQVLQLSYGNYTEPLPLMGVALALIRIMKTNQIRVS